MNEGNCCACPKHPGKREQVEQRQRQQQHTNTVTVTRGRWFCHSEHSIKIQILCIIIIMRFFTVASEKRTQLFECEQLLLLSTSRCFYFSAGIWNLVSWGGDICPTNRTNKMSSLILPVVFFINISNNNKWVDLNAQPKMRGNSVTFHRFVYGVNKFQFIFKY